MKLLTIKLDNPRENQSYNYAACVAILKSCRIEFDIVRDPAYVAKVFDEPQSDEERFVIVDYGGLTLIDHFALMHWIEAMRLRPRQLQ